MREVCFKIDKSEVMREVHKTTAYEGKLLPPMVLKDGTMVRGGGYQRIATTRANEELLTRYWHEGMAALVRIIGQAPIVFLRSRTALSDKEPDSLHIDIDMPDNWRGSVDEVKAECEVFLTDCVVAGWLTAANSDKASQYGEKLVARANGIKTLLSARVRPRGSVLPPEERTIISVQ